jgi:N-dimethylarginine dimethylaminohydrolase
MLSVHQHWDPLKVCAVGRSYPPEFYSYIKNAKVRNVFEKIAQETEEDYQKLISKLEEFNVKVLRTDISDDLSVYDMHREDGASKKASPPMTPRDYTIMVGNKFFMPGENYGDAKRYLHDVVYGRRDENYDEIVESLENNPEVQKYLYDLLLPGRPVNIDSVVELKRILKKGLGRCHMSVLDHKAFMAIASQSSTNTIGRVTKYQKFTGFDQFKTIREYVESHGNEIVYDTHYNAATMTRIGKDLYISYSGILNKLNEKRIKENWRNSFPDYRTHAIDLPGHTDGAFCPVKPGLIISIDQQKHYEKSFPGWEVVYLPNQSWSKVKPHLNTKAKLKKRYWVPGEEENDAFHDYVTEWMDDWVTYVEETVFDVNMLVIDEKNVICNNENDQVFEAFERHGITPHVINFRHRYFWDGGLHCITSDLHREGTRNDYFPDRG